MYTQAQTASTPALPPIGLRPRGRPIGELLIEMGVVGAEGLAEGLAAQHPGLHQPQLGRVDPHLRCQRDRRIQLNPRSTLAIKLNFYDERSSSTYLGLTTPQFAEDPNAQNARYDRFTIRRYALWMNHTHLFTDHVALRTT